MTRKRNEKISNFWPCSGHYTAFAKHWQTGQWHSYNDSRYTHNVHLRSSYPFIPHPLLRFLTLLNCRTFQGEQMQLIKCDNERGLPPFLWALFVTRPPTHPEKVTVILQILKIRSNDGILWYTATVRKHFCSFLSTIVKCYIETRSAKIDDGGALNPLKSDGDTISKWGNPATNIRHYMCDVQRWQPSCVSPNGARRILSTSASCKTESFPSLWVLYHTYMNIYWSICI